MGPMLDALDAVCRQRGIAWHYMSAREAYNVVKAAERGYCGNPEEFRDFLIPKPRNMLFRPPISLTANSAAPSVTEVGHTRKQTP